MSGSEQDKGDVQLAALIVQVRKAQGLSMEAFATCLGVSQPTQSRIERAKRLPDALYLRALRTKFQVDINALLEGDASTAPDPSASDLPSDYHASASQDKAHSIKTSSRRNAAEVDPSKSRKRAA